MQKFRLFWIDLKFAACPHRARERDDNDFNNDMDSHSRPDRAQSDVWARNRAIASGRIAIVGQHIRGVHAPNEVTVLAEQNRFRSRTLWTEANRPARAYSNESEAQKRALRNENAMRELLSEIESLRSPEAIHTRIRAAGEAKDWCDRMEKALPVMPGNVQTQTLPDGDSLWNVRN